MKTTKNPIFETKTVCSGFVFVSKFYLMISKKV